MLYFLTYFLTFKVDLTSLNICKALSRLSSCIWTARHHTLIIVIDCFTSVLFEAHQNLGHLLLWFKTSLLLWHLWYLKEEAFEYVSPKWSNDCGWAHTTWRRGASRNTSRHYYSITLLCACLTPDMEKYSLHRLMELQQFDTNGIASRRLYRTSQGCSSDRLITWISNSSVKLVLASFIRGSGLRHNEYKGLSTFLQLN